jgi:hypothetical protein
VTLRDATPSDDPTDAARTGTLALRLLMSESPLLGGQAALPLARRDHRGVAVAAVDADGIPVAPFSDADADGLADIDERGRFIDADGNALAVPAPFEPPAGDPPSPVFHRDADGRALAGPDGGPLYAYVDLDRTLLAALSRDAVAWFDPDRGTALDLVRGASALLSTRVSTAREYANGESLAYVGYESRTSPLLDMLHGYLSLLAYPDADAVLALIRSLVVDHEPETARLLEAVLEAKDVAAAHDEAHMDPHAPFADDLVPIVRDILAVPGLAEDLLRALEDPALASVDRRVRDTMAFADRFDFDADQNLVGSFSTPVDRSAPDDGYNRSLLQRVLHLLDDANGAVLCNKQGGQVTDPLGLGIPIHTYGECELFRIDNLSLLFVQSMAYARDASGGFTCRGGSPGRNAAGYWRCPDGARPIGKARLDFHWQSVLIQLIVNDDLIEQMATIDGFTTRPTPEALTRALFLDPMPPFLAKVMDPGETRFGERFIDAHAGTLPVFEADGSFDQLQPLVQAFADHDAELLLVRLLSALHAHWPSQQSNAVSYEPAIVDILDRDDNVLDALRGAAPVVNESVDVLTDFARYAFAPQPGLANRRGDTASETIEGQPIPVLSPVQLLLDAYALKRDRLAVTGDAGEAWQRSVGNLADVLLRGEVAGGWRFANPRLRGVSALLVDFLRERLRAHDDAGDRTRWLLVDLPADVEHVVAGPVFAGAADLVDAVHARPETRRQIERLVQYLVNEAEHGEAFRLSLASVADLLQLGLDDRDIVPIARVVGEALRPERGWLDSQTALVRDAVAGDRAGALAALLRQLFDEWAPGRTAIGGIVDGIAEVQRVRPYVDLGAAYTEADHRALLHGVADFLDDEKRGLRRFISIVEGREP